MKNKKKIIHPNRWAIIKKALYRAFALFVAIVFLLSCSTTRSLKKEELLYTGSKVKVENLSFFNKIALKGDLKDFIGQQPNDKWFGLFPVKLYMYNLAGDSVPKKGFRRWVQKKLGQPPVIYNPSITGRSANTMKAYLYSKGYFQGKVAFAETKKNKKMQVTYQVEVSEPYTINTIVFPKKDSSTIGIISKNKESSLLKKGMPYDLGHLKEERQRINKLLKNKGYYYFRPEYILFEIDSNSFKKNINVYVTVNKDIPKRAFNVYQLNNIDIYPGFSLKQSTKYKDTVRYNGYTIYKNEKTINHRVLLNSVFLEKGNIYKEKEYTRTIHKLTGLNLFKFVNIKFDDTLIDGQHMLNADILLTTTLSKTFSAEVQAQTKSNNFTGPGVSVEYTDRNFFNGAENFNTQFSSGFETQIANNKSSLNSFEFSIDQELSFPNIVFPFANLNQFLSPKYTPRTNFRASFRALDRLQYFTLHNANFSFGYDWKSSEKHMHDLIPFSLTYTNLFNRSSKFKKIMSEDEFLRESFREQLISSLTYNYVFNSKMFTKRDITYYFNANVEIAGNTASLVKSAFLNEESIERKPEKLFGIAYSQYLLAFIDTRVFFSINENSSLVYRWFSGAGYPYGNSMVMPYKSQFFVGGASGLRGFPFRSVGPGSYSPKEKENLFDQTGDIKLENNFEFRYTIAGIFKSALFAGAGNVWLFKNKNTHLNEEFSFSHFHKQLAVSAGTGLRIAPRFFVLRFDVGIPLRKPQLEKGNRWVVDHIRPASSSWRKKNIVISIAIGYPF